MTWRFATIHETRRLAAEHLRGVQIDGSPAFRAVHELAATDLPAVKRWMQAQSNPPVAGVMAGPADFAERGARAKREMELFILILAEYTGDLEAGKASTVPAERLADATIAAFLPLATAKARQRVLDGVIFEPTGHQPETLDGLKVGDFDAYQVGLMAVDFMAERD